jgi:serine/threonine protein kinase
LFKKVEQEALAMQKCNHKNIIKFHGFDVEISQGQLCILMTLANLGDVEGFPKLLKAGSNKKIPAI